MRPPLLAALLTCVFASLSHAQGAAADYDRAEKLAQRFGGKVTHAHVEPHWFAQNHFWFKSDGGPGQWEFITVNCESAQRAPAFDHAKLALALSKSTGAEIPATRLPLDNLDFSDDA